MTQTPEDETFAAVLNGLSLGAGRRKHEKSTEDNPGVRYEPVWSEPEPVADHAPTSDLSWVDNEDLPAAPADAAIVRPYSWTRGRTRSTVDLRIEALVTTSERGDDLNGMTQTEHRSVAELCREPRSVAEIATGLRVPLGVAKVLVGDMAELGLVIVHKTATGGANKAHLLLMERVLSGLRRL
jgi:Protein of unknown function (DUF742)